MIKYFDLITDFIVSPKAAFDGLKKENKIRAAFWIFTVAILTKCIFEQVLFSDLSGLLYFLIRFALEFALNSVFVILFLSWVHMAAGFYNKEIDVRVILSAFLFSYVPLYVVSPVVPVLSAWTSNPWAWYIMFGFVSMLWVSILLYLGIKNVYSLSTARTLFVLFSPLILLSVLTVICSVTLGLVIYKLIAS